MKSKLVIGLGNPLSGDDGIGLCVAERLANDSRVAGCAEIILNGGTDLLRLTDRLMGRKEVIVLDSILDDSVPGTVSVLDDQTVVKPHRASAHHLSAFDAVRLLKTVDSSLADTRFTFILVSLDAVHSVRTLSPVLTRKLPQIVDQVRQIISSA
jgi:hydrogenase maturation protease